MELNNYILQDHIFQNHRLVYITSGIFQLWRAQGLMTQIHLKYASRGSLIGTIISLTAGYFHMHSFCSSSFTSLRRVHHLIVLFVLFGLRFTTGFVNEMAHEIIMFYL